MSNFRQYYGNHRLDFAKGEKNITLILGENNAGKTGIYRALIYALYGDRSLPQDEKAQINLVNFDAIDDHGPVKASVRVSLSHGGFDYIVERGLYGSKYGDDYVQENNEDVSLKVVDDKGNEEVYSNADREKIEKTINNILDENIKEFFLFDGEKMETLARTDNKSKKEVKDGIIKLMQIDQLERLGDILAKATSSQLKRLRNQAGSSQLNVIKKQTEKFQKEKEKLKTEIEDLEKNILDREDLLDKYQSKVDSAKDISKTYRELEYKEDLLFKQKRLTKMLKNQIIGDLDGYSHLLLMDYYREMDNVLANELTERKESIPQHLLEESLDQQKCSLCDQDLDEISYSRIEQILKYYKSSYETDLMGALSRNIKDELKLNQENLDNLEPNLERIERARLDLEELEEEVNRLNQIILTYNLTRKDLGFTEREKIKLEEEISDIKIELMTRKEKLLVLEEELSGLNKDLEGAIKKETMLDYQNKKYVFMNDLTEKLKKLFVSYEESTKEKLGKSTTKMFKLLIDDEEKSLVDRVEINDKYELELYEKDMKVTADISQGQQMVVALAFITSLASLASNSRDRVDYPLFMDTPFGRLSRQNRYNLIERLPLVTKQWIPLLTDTDYTNYEKGIFEKNNKVGHVYLIEKIDSRRSAIRKIG